MGEPKQDTPSTPTEKEKERHCESKLKIADSSPASEGISTPDDVNAQQSVKSTKSNDDTVSQTSTSQANVSTTPLTTSAVSTSESAAEHDKPNDKSNGQHKSSPPTPRRSRKLTRTKSFSGLSNLQTKGDDIRTAEVTEAIAKDDTKVPKEKRDEDKIRVEIKSTTNDTIDNSQSPSKDKGSDSPTNVITSSETSPRRFKTPLQTEEKKSPSVSSQQSPRTHASTISLDSALSKATSSTVFIDSSAKPFTYATFRRENIKEFKEIKESKKDSKDKEVKDKKKTTKAKGDDSGRTPKEENKLKAFFGRLFPMRSASDSNTKSKHKDEMSTGSAPSSPAVAGKVPTPLLSVPSADVSFSRRNAASNSTSSSSSSPSLSSLSTSPSQNSSTTSSSEDSQRQSSTSPHSGLKSSSDMRDKNPAPHLVIERINEFNKDKGPSSSPTDNTSSSPNGKINIAPDINNSTTGLNLSGNFSSSSSTSSNIETPTSKTSSTEYSKVRHKVINELIKTEKEYVADIKLLINKCLLPLRHNGKIIAPSDVELMFSNIEMVELICTEFLAELEKKIEGMDNSLDKAEIGQIFLDYADELSSTYIHYALHQAEAVGRFHKLKTRSAFANFLKELYALPEFKNHDLPTFLAKPTTRVCKYPLLLKEIEKHTFDDHPDKQAIKKALVAMEELLAKVNEATKESQNLQELYQLEEKFVGAPEKLKFLVPGRKIVREGILTKISNNKASSRYFFLFNDMILYAKYHQSKSKYEFRGVIPLRSCQIEDTPDTNEYKFAIKVTRTLPDKVYLIICPNIGEKRGWLAELTATQKAFAQQTKPTELQATKTNVFSIRGAFRKTTRQQELVMMQVEARISGWKNDNPQRYLVREKPIKVTNHKMKEIENRYLFLFNDIFLIAKRRGSRRLMASSSAPFICVRWFYFRTVTAMEPLINEGNVKYAFEVTIKTTNPPMSQQQQQQQSQSSKSSTPSASTQFKLIFICESLADRTLLMKDMGALMRGEAVQASGFVQPSPTETWSEECQESKTNNNGASNRSAAGDGRRLVRNFTVPLIKELAFEEAKEAPKQNEEVQEKTELPADTKAEKSVSSEKFDQPEVTPQKTEKIETGETNREKADNKEIQENESKTLAPPSQEPNAQPKAQESSTTNALPPIPPRPKKAETGTTAMAPSTQTSSPPEPPPKQLSSIITEKDSSSTEVTASPSATNGNSPQVSSVET